MKKILPLLFFLAAAVVNGQAPDWSWSQTASGTSDEHVSHMAMDASGNLIITGKFSSATSTLSGVTLTNSGSSGTSEFLLAKYSSSGSLLWAKRAQGAGDDEGVAVTTDPTGNIYVAGNYDSPTIVFGTTTLTNSSPFPEVFLVKYDPSGNVLWARTYGGNLLDDVYALATDNSGNSYLTGSFRSLSVSFGTVGVVNSGNSDGYLAKIDVNGNAIWAKQFGAGQNEYGMAVTLDGSGNVYVAGEFDSPNLTTFNLSNAGAADMFLVKYDVSGNYHGSKAFGGTQNDSPRYLATDAAGNLYLASTFQSATLGLGTFTLTNGSTRDIALIKMTNTLVPQWGKKASGNITSEPSALAVDAGGVYMTGRYDLSGIGFGTASLTNPSSASEGFLVRYDLSGNDLWAKATSGSGDEELHGVVADAAGNVYVTGTYNASLSLGSSTLTLAGGKDLFVSKLCMVPAMPVAVQAGTACARSTVTLNVTTAGGVLASWYNSATGGSTLLTGSNSFTVKAPATVYAEAVNPATGCSNPLRVAVSVSVQPPPTVSVSGKTLTASSGSAFQWFECKKDSVVTNGTQQNFNLTKSGHYAVIVTNNGCVDTSACYYYSVTATGTITVPEDSILVTIAEHPDAESLPQIYPNPNNGEFSLRSSFAGEVTLHDLWGRIVRSWVVERKEPLKISVTELPSGIYYFSGAGGRFLGRVIISK